MSDYKLALIQDAHNAIKNFLHYGEEGGNMYQPLIDMRALLKKIEEFLE